MRRFSVNFSVPRLPSHCVSLHHCSFLVLFRLFKKKCYHITLSTYHMPCAKSPKLKRKLAEAQRINSSSAISRANLKLRSHYLKAKFGRSLHHEWAQTARLHGRDGAILSLVGDAKAVLSIPAGKEVAHRQDLERIRLQMPLLGWYDRSDSAPLLHVRWAIPRVC